MRKIVFLLLILLLTGCVFNNEKKYISNTMNVNLNNCNMISSYDTHGGFLGDGDYFAKLSCNNFDISKDFQEMPLEDSIYELLNIKWCSNVGCQNVFEKYQIPILKKGYYYYRDRKPDIENSYNYSILIYDDTSQILYYYEQDT